MAIAKSQAGALQLTDTEVVQVREIESLLDKRITQTGGTDVHVWKNEWSSKPPSAAVIAALKAKFEAPGMGWTLSVQPDRDGPIIWLK